MQKNNSIVPLSPENQQAADRLIAGWKRKKFLTTLIWGLLTTVLIVLFCSAREPSGKEYATAAMIVMLPASLILLVILAVQDAFFRKEVRQTPELETDNLDPAVITVMKLADQEYEAQLQELKRYRGIVLAVGLVFGFVFPPVFLLSCVIAIFFVPAKLQMKDQYYCNPRKRLIAYGESGSKKIGCGAVTVFLIFCSLSIFYSMIGYVAHSKTEALNAEAKSVYLAANQWLSDCAEMEIPVEAGKYIGCFTDEVTDSNSLTAAMHLYYNIEKPDWYAVIIDTSGKIQYAFYKHEMITENDLTPMTKEQQIKLFSTLAHQKDAVGWYKAETEEPNEPF